MPVDYDALYDGLRYDVVRDEWDCVGCDASWKDCEPVEMAKLVAEHECKNERAD